MGGESDGFGVVAEGNRAAVFWDEHGAMEFSGLPFEVDLDAAAGDEALDGSFLPVRRQSGEEVNQVSVRGFRRSDRAFSMDGEVRLDQHFHHAGSGAEIAIDLERWMGIEQVRIHAAAAELSFFSLRANGFEQVAEDFHRAVAIEKACPQIRFPAHRPAGGFIAAEFERLLRCGKKFGGLPVDFIPWIRGPEV